MKAENTETTKMSITVPVGIPELFANIAGGERKKGAWLTGVLLSIKDGGNVPDANSIETLQLQIVGLNAKLNALQSRLDAIQA